MANKISSIIKIEPEGAREKIHNIINQCITNGGTKIQLVKAFYPEFDENKSESELSDWMFNNLGTSDLIMNADDNLNVETNGWFPDGFLIRLFFTCCDEFDNVKIHCNWKDDTENQCGVAVVHYGFYAEEDSIFGSNDINDIFYNITGDEVIYDVQSWLLRYADESGDVTKWEVQIMEDDKIRNTFVKTKDKLKKIEIEKIWAETYDYCMDAIYLEDYDYLTGKLIKISNKKYNQFPDIYPFK